ncbi:hypothetical protein KIN20_013972 [Parelaphostrongylus tenuis]|uniref:Uncharacterized protein n=1 Tax=Parelaphostrongylus tenuis TaxID=148309 RepID=A0AAD5MWT2_PARTN|nr:hypothetical protein KIN20_013972 [Parelaphostrongylus tenuis]
MLSKVCSSENCSTTRRQSPPTSTGKNSENWQKQCEKDSSFEWRPRRRLESTEDGEDYSEDEQQWAIDESSAQDQSDKTVSSVYLCTLCGYLICDQQTTVSLNYHGENVFFMMHYAEPELTDTANLRKLIRLRDELKNSKASLNLEKVNIIWSVFMKIKNVVYWTRVQKSHDEKRRALHESNRKQMLGVQKKRWGDVWMIAPTYNDTVQSPLFQSMNCDWQI